MKRRVFAVIDPQVLFDFLTDRKPGQVSLGVVEMVSTDQDGSLVFTVAGGDELPPDGARCNFQYRIYEAVGGRMMMFDGLKPQS